jgi:hypothetical protein
MKGSPTRTDYTGKRVGKLVVIRRIGARGGKWECKCDCGNAVVLNAADLVFRRSCGCLKGKQSFKHGMWKTTFYKKYGSIRRRCEDPKDISYPMYGGRGIRFLWPDFISFMNDMYPSYLLHKRTHTTTSIERIDNKGHYCKENCRWATAGEQAKNRSTSHFITYNGRTQIATDWARELGITPTSFFSRLRRLGSIEKILICINR